MSDLLLEDKYLKEMEEWNKECNSIIELRESEINKLLNKEKQSYSENLNANHKATVDMITEKIEETKRKISSAEKKRSSLGFFKFGEKSALNKLIKDESIKLNNLESKLEDENFDFSQSQSDKKEFFEKLEREIREEIERKYKLPFDTKPIPPHTGKAEKRSKYLSQEQENLIEEVYEILCDYYPHATHIEELSKIYFPSKSNQTLSSAIFKLVKEEKVERIVCGRRSYFRLWR